MTLYAPVLSTLLQCLCCHKDCDKSTEVEVNMENSILYFLIISICLLTPHT